MFVQWGRHIPITSAVCSNHGWFSCSAIFLRADPSGVFAGLTGNSVNRQQDKRTLNPEKRQLPKCSGVDDNDDIRISFPTPPPSPHLFCNTACHKVYISQVSWSQWGESHPRRLRGRSWGGREIGASGNDGGGGGGGGGLPSFERAGLNSLTTIPSPSGDNEWKMYYSSWAQHQVMEHIDATILHSIQANNRLPGMWLAESQCRWFVDFAVEIRFSLFS